MTEATIIGGNELAAIIGVTGQRLNELARNGTIPKIGRGKYDLHEAVAAYCENLREQAARAGRPPKDDKPGIEEAKERLTLAQAELAETKAAAARGDLVDAQAVQREWQSILRDLRNALLAVPSRAAATLPHLTPTDVSTIDQELRKALEGVVHG